MWENCTHKHTYTASDAQKYVSCTMVIMAAVRDTAVGRTTVASQAKHIIRGEIFNETIVFFGVAVHHYQLWHNGH